MMKEVKVTKMEKNKQHPHHIETDTFNRLFFYSWMKSGPQKCMQDKNVSIFIRLGRCYDSMTPLATNKIKVQVPLLNLRVEREAEADDADKLITILVSTLYIIL